MSRIKELFGRKNKNVLNVYCTAGYPSLGDTLPVMKALQDAGVDMIELGMPYSDPLADGPMIQYSSSRALANGMTIHTLFDQLNNFRKEIHLPVLLMGYMNPVLQYGFEKFCRRASESGVDGLILPDLPMFEFEKEFAPVIKKYGLDFVFLVTPETKEDRVRKLDQLSSGFLYAVSSSSTTGKNTLLGDQKEYFNRLKAMKLKNPILIGFGIKDKTGFTEACAYANGAIVGTAFIRVLEKASGADLSRIAGNFINSLK
jgi:tryptophan synthase alpha chain